MIQGICQSKINQLSEDAKELFTILKNEAEWGLVGNLWKVCCYGYSRGYFLQDEISMIQKLMGLDIIRIYKEGYYMINPDYYFINKQDLISCASYEGHCLCGADAEKYYRNRKAEYCACLKYCEDSILELEIWNEEMKEEG